MTNFQDAKMLSNHDEYMTRKISWEQISKYLPKDKIIWEAFYGNGQSGKYLRELGFKVIHKKIDFFKSNEGDIIVSNPPFSKKREVFARLRSLNKPFVMLVPTTVLHTLYLQESFGKERLQLIIPYKKNEFDKYVEGKIQHKKDNCSFYTLYICWKMKLPRDIILI